VALFVFLLAAYLVDLVMCYKILNNHVCVDADSFFTRRVGYHTRGNCVKLYKTHTASVRGGHFFSNRTINVWKSLPDTVVSSVTVTGFKLKFSLDHALTVTRLCNLGASIRAGFLPWCPGQHIFRHTVFVYILLLFVCCQINLIWFDIQVVVHLEFGLLNCSCCMCSAVVAVAAADYSYITDVRAY